MRRAAVLLVALGALWAAPSAWSAGWCGSGEQIENRPAAVTGPQVRVVYALPSDGVDNFGPVANAAADDAAAIDAWWQGQDPARTIRFDLADFGGCMGLDVAFLRLAETGAAIADAPNPFARVVGALTSAGLRSQYERYVVYYDGPVSSARVCGTGGELSGGAGAAVVWMQACPTVMSAWTAAHELLHALGAVPTGAPHECPAPNGGHVCDLRTDIMYAFATGGALFTTALLDPGRDDYYGTGKSGDTRLSPFLRRLDAALVPVAVSFSGAGRVTSAAPGVDCTAACTTQWETGSDVWLMAAGTRTSRFIRWTGACSGSDDCRLSPSGAANVTAVFGPATVPVRTNVSGRGRIVCTPRCSTRFAAGNPLVLRAVAKSGWRFAGWTGACRGTKPVCRPTTDFPLSARAIFRRR